MVVINVILNAKNNVLNV